MASACPIEPMNNPASIHAPDRRRLLGLAAGSLALTACASPMTRTTPPAPTSTATDSVNPAARPLATQAELQLQLAARLRYWVDVPEGYADEPTRRWPLIVFLHGSGERGHDLAAVRVHGLPKHLDAGLRVPAIVVSPQCEPDLDWDPHQLHALLIHLKGSWRIDERRVTATGLSMGGAGCWDWATNHPDDLAGIAPVCGFGRRLRIAQMRSVPVRAYHGLEDTVVPPSASRELVDGLRTAGGQADLTLYPGVGHDAWTPAYADPGLVPWLLAQRRS
jgi:predicted peptidase